MESRAVKKNPKTRRLAIVAGVVVISALAILMLAASGYLFAFKDRVFPGVTVNGLSLSGLTKEAAGVKLNAAVTIFENNGLNFSYQGETKKIETVVLPAGNIDAARQIFDMDPDIGLSAAYAVGHNCELVECLRQAGAALTGQTAITLPYTLDDAGFKAALKKAWELKETPVRDASITIAMNGNIFAGSAATPDKSGFEFDYGRAISEFKDKISGFDQTATELQPARTEPTIRLAHANEASSLIPAALSLAPLKMSADEFKWTLEAGDLAPLLKVILNSNGYPTLGINKALAMEYFKKLASDYDIIAADTRYEIDPVTQKMTVFEQGRNGRRVDIERSIVALETVLNKQLSNEDGKKDFNIVVTAAKSQIVTATGSDLGIKEVIGVGQSDFSGSSTTRIKNVRHGSDKLNGILIAPDAEFSALAALEPITIEDGYFPEQIILGDKIEPGVGGGLCQIGTTLFRMAMNTGLPITERQNHSLVVHYYSDPTNGNPGTDATLYGPHPDLRFINNTGHWMLLTTDVNVKTKKLTYTLWGTSDGRHGSYTPPKVTSWIAAPKEVTNIEDPSLKPGEQKCQNPFSGAKTSFIYTIVNPDGTITDRTFNSYYRALPKICTNGPALPGTVLPDGTIVPPDDTNTNANTNANVPANTNLNLPPEATQGN